MSIILILFMTILIFLICFCILVFYKIDSAHKEQFKRADYDDFSYDWLLVYPDLASKYPRETLKIPSGKNVLTGFFYGMDNKKGLIIISSGHRCATEYHLQDIKYFVDNGWMVFCYDYTGYYNSEGKNMIDYIQSVKDLDAVLAFLEKTNGFHEIPFMLYGHSLGAYATAAVLRFNHKISAAVVASGFDKPIEQWSYSVKRFTGKIGTVLGIMAGIYLRTNYGKDTVSFSAVEGINSVDIPVLVFSGVEDEFYGGKSPIYMKKDKIRNPNCSYMLMENNRHNGHYDYMLTDRAIDYQKFCRENANEIVDKWIIMEHDKSYFDRINSFFLQSLQL